MKKIINGKKYDTETAKMLGHENNIGDEILARSDFRFRESALYQKKTGEYFIWHNSNVGVEHIEPCSEEDAKRWAENNMSVEEYEAIWGEVEE